MPYTCSLASDKAAALRELAACDPDQSIMDFSREKPDETPGILSKRLQDADPFTLHWSRLEVADIRGCFAAHLQKADTAQRDPQTNFEAATRAAARISIIF